MDHNGDKGLYSRLLLFGEEEEYEPNCIPNFFKIQQNISVVPNFYELTSQSTPTPQPLPETQPTSPKTQPTPSSLETHPSLTQTKVTHVDEFHIPSQTQCRHSQAAFSYEQYWPSYTTRIKEKKVPPSTARKKGTHVPKTNGKGTPKVSLAPKQLIVRNAAQICKGKMTLNSMENEDEDNEYDDSLDGDYGGESLSETDVEELELEELELEEELVDDDKTEGRLCFKDFLEGDNVADKIYMNGYLVEDMEFGQINLYPWMIFKNKAHLKLVLKDYCVQEGFGLVYSRSEGCRITAECMMEGCDWRIHASQLPDKRSWAIKTLNPGHNCERVEYNPMVDAKWLVSKLLDDIKANPSIPVRAMQQLVLERYRIIVKKRLMYKVKSMAIEEINGGHDNSYALLPRYVAMVKSSNPGSYAFVNWHNPKADGVLHFNKCFISFGAQLKGFLQGCRPFIGVDGCHLKGTYGGVLLSAISLDGNNELYPVAIAIVREESLETWSYFFQSLSLALSTAGNSFEEWTFMSDRQKGVDKSLFSIFPKCQRRICAQHLYKNFKGKFPGEAFHDLFWIAANAYTKYVYDKAMKLMEELDPTAVEWLAHIPEQWSRHQFDYRVVCDHNTNNFVESFNALQSIHRDSPVLTLLEAIRCDCMNKIAERMENIHKLESAEQHLTPWAKKEIEMISLDSRTCKVTKSGGGKYEIKDANMQYPVDMRERRCLCGQWQGKGLPCRHAMRVILDNGFNVQDFVYVFFKMNLYKLTYSEHIHPMTDSSQWPLLNLPTILPPVMKRSLGRPTKNRKRSKDEPRKEKRNSCVRCKKCKELGHNSRTCQGGLTAKEKKAREKVAASSQPISSSSQPIGAKLHSKKRKGADENITSSRHCNDF